MNVALPSIDRINSLLDEGRPLDAWEFAQAEGHPASWPVGVARRAGARLAGALGAPRLKRVLHYLNWRNNRGDPQAHFDALFARIRHTPGADLLAELRDFLAAQGPMSHGDKASLMAFGAWIHSTHRDFSPAFRDVREALALAPEDPWIHVQHSLVCAAADRYEEALAAAREAVRLGPLKVSAVTRCAEALIHSGEDDEAIRLLLEADGATQHAGFALRLQALFSEREDHLQALWCLDRVEARSPMMEPSLRKWIDGRRADFHYMAGDIDTALEWCDRRGEGFHRKMAERLRRPGARNARRVRLDVPFVRQHRMTCAPATLAALSAYWGANHDHLHIANAICHEGTPWHKERKWARENGFVTREFRLTAESLREVIDRGIPFTLTTEAPTSGHLQACIGYDERTGVVLLRDPTERHFGEMFLDGLIDDHPLGGPRAMLLVPETESGKLVGLRLPDEAAYDAYHDLLEALDGHDRWRLDAALSTLRAVAPEHPLTLLGEERAAAWREDHPGHLRRIERLLEVAPGHERTLLRKAEALRRLGRWQDLRGFLEEVTARPGADPVFHAELGELLTEDARLLSRAEFHLRAAIRKRRGEARHYESLGRLRSKQLRREEAMRLRRISSSLAPDFEPYASGYFETCRAAGKTAEGIDFLNERVERYGAKSGGPWITLARAVNQANDERRAAEVLERAVEVRPDDGQLRLSAGVMMAGWGEPHRQRGLEWMEWARGRVGEVHWLMESARIAAFLGDRNKAIRCWKSVIARQPLHIDAWRGLARMTAESGGEDAAIELLDEATARHPESVELWCLKAEWLAGTRRGAIEALDVALRLDAAHVWALRERAIRLMDAGRTEEAERDAREAAAIDPWSPGSFGVLGMVLARADRRDEAVEHLREAIRMSVDYTYACHRLMDLARGREEESAFLDFILCEMKRQVSDGSIVPVYQKLAWPVVEPMTLLGQLRNFCNERPDLWETWSARVEQALRMRMDAEALDAAQRLVDSFPLLPRAWLDLARVHQAAGRHDEECRATSRAVELSPGWDEAARAHAQVLELLGRADEAVEVLRHACRLDPLNGANHGCLADTLRRNRRCDEALGLLREALRLCPFYGWGWEAAARWALEDGSAAAIKEDLRVATDIHGHSLAWWSTASSAWDALGERNEAIAAAKHGLAIRPKDVDLRDQLAFLLWREHRHEEALAVCRPADGEESAPLNLRGRHAWLLMRSGHPLKGVEAMRELLRAEPSYAWGMAELAAWHDRRGEWQELRELCRQWLRVSPRETRVLGYLGRAERALDHKTAAEEAFARAFALDPEYLFAGRQLMDLQMIRGDLTAAAVTLARMEHYSDSCLVVCDAIELELKRRDTAAALARAEGLLDHRGADLPVFSAVAALFREHSEITAWRKWIGARVTEGKASAPGALAGYLATVPVEKVLAETKRRIAKGSYPPEAVATAWIHTISELRKGGKPFVRALRGLAKNRSAAFHGHPQIWNSLGEALLEVGEPAICADWLGGWEQRLPDVNAGTLINLAAAVDTCPGREHERWQHSGKLRAEGFRRFPDSDNAQALRAGHAFHLAADGRLDEAEAVLADFERGQTSEFYQALGDGANAMVAAGRGREADAREFLKKSLQHLSRFNDLGSVRLRERAERVVAERLPWAKGSRRRLRRKWALAVGAKPPGPLTRDRDIPVWPFVIALYFIIKACVGAASGQ